MVVCVRQQSQKARALDCGIQLTLVMRFCACQTCGDDLACFRDEITQGIDILVIDFFNAGRREAAEFATFEQWVLLRKLTAFILAFFHESHDSCLYDSEGMSL